MARVTMVVGVVGVDGGGRRADPGFGVGG